MNEQHFAPTSAQVAGMNRATQNSRDFFGHGNQVNSRQGNQQQRITQGVRSGQLTAGATRNLENRASSINRQAQSDRAANGGYLTGQQRQQISQRQNNLSRAIYNDKHSANTAAAAAARQGTTTQNERWKARRAEYRHRPQR